MPLNAKLHLETVLRHGRTTLQSTICTQPLKVANITEDRRQNQLHLMLMSASPGILDNDAYELRFDVGQGCRLTLETQAYQRLFQMQTGASQTIDVRLAENSFLSYLPHPLVPHRGSVFEARSRIHLEKTSSLLWGEVMSCGRKLNGEVFAFSSYQNRTEIYREGKLVVKENILLRPAEMDLNAIGQLEGFSHQATLLYLDERSDLKTLIDEVLALADEAPHLALGVSALPVKGLVVRCLGTKAEELFQLLRKLALLLTTSKPISQSKIVADVA